MVVWFYRRRVNIDDGLMRVMGTWKERDKRVCVGGDKKEKKKHVALSTRSSGS